MIQLYIKIEMWYLIETKWVEEGPGKSVLLADVFEYMYLYLMLAKPVMFFNHLIWQQFVLLMV